MTTTFVMKHRCFDPIIAEDGKLVFPEKERWYNLDTKRHIKEDNRKGFEYDQNFKICGKLESVRKMIDRMMSLELIIHPQGTAFNNKAAAIPFDNKATGRAFGGKFVEAQIVNVIDAETVVLTFVIESLSSGKSINTGYTESCRMLGIDSGEKHDSNGLIAKKVRAMLERNRIVYAILDHFDNKLGFLPVILYMDKGRKQNISKMILDANKDHVCEYWSDIKILEEPEIILPELPASTIKTKDLLSNFVTLQTQILVAKAKTQDLITKTKETNIKNSKIK